MKHLKLTIILFVLVGTFFSCKKDDDQTIEQLQQNKIEDIISAEYLDTLRNLGLVIHEGTTPPNVNGIYGITPFILKATNIPSDVIGMSFLDADLKLFNQNNSNFEIQLLGKNFLNSRDTSVVTAISGIGNKFTVYGKVKSNATDKAFAYFGLIVSGEIENGTIINLESGIINIDDSNGGGFFIKEGEARLAVESDKVSDILETF